MTESSGSTTEPARMPPTAGVQEPARTPPLAGVRIVECSMLGPGAVTTHLADLGADVIKVEPPAGDYIREMTWPIVEGVSLMHLHVSRGKRSITLDLRTEEGRAVFVELAFQPDEQRAVGLGQFDQQMVLFGAEPVPGLGFGQQQPAESL